MPVGADGRVHTMYSHNPTTLRLASQNPNLQNLPRPNKADPEALVNLIRNLFVAGEGQIFLARDYSGIEAVLVGYFARARDYIRLAKLDVHTFYTMYALYQLDGTVAAADLPELGWSDDKLIPHLKHWKGVLSDQRNRLYKHLVHGANFAQTPMGAREKVFKETGREYPVKTIATVMGVYFDLFPAIKTWHSTLLNQAEKDGFLRNPFGYVHRFHRVYKYHKVGARWEKEPGEDANKVIAYLPQSTAAGIIKEAIMRLYFERFEEAGQYLRLQIHDEILSEVPEDRVYEVDCVMKQEMERPITCMRLPDAYNMGEYLTIDTEPKAGRRWGEMK